MYLPTNYGYVILFANAVNAEERRIKLQVSKSIKTINTAIHGTRLQRIASKIKSFAGLL